MERWQSSSTLSKKTMALGTAIITVYGEVQMSKTGVYRVDCICADISSSKSNYKFISAVCRTRYSL